MKGSSPVQHPLQRARLPEHSEKGHGGAAEKGPSYPASARDRRAVQGAVCASARITSELLLDTSGDGLHKRGYRRNATEAPIKETLAAAIVDLSRVRRDSRMEDPFCGSGTMVIEAAQKALNIAPGLRRRFAAERYTDLIPPQAWAASAGRRPSRRCGMDAAFEAVGYDIDPQAVALAQHNAKLAGVAERCRFEVADVAELCCLRPEQRCSPTRPTGSGWET